MGRRKVLFLQQHGEEAIIFPSSVLKKLLFLYLSEEETIVLYLWEEGPIVFFRQRDKEAIVL